MKFASTWNKFFKHCISVEFLLVEGYLKGALRKELRIAPFVERFKTTFFGKVLLMNFASTWKVIYRMLYERSCSLILS